MGLAWMDSVLSYVNVQRDSLVICVKQILMIVKKHHVSMVHHARILQEASHALA
jgi:hypothetical protein